MSSRSSPPAGAPETTGTSPSLTVWPVTIVIVMLGMCLLVWDWFVAVINVAPFFGEQPGRDALIESGMAMVTAVAPIGAMCAIAWRAGSRWGLLFLVAPTALLMIWGVQSLLTPGDPDDPHPGRFVRPGDVVGELTLPNWVVAALAMTVLLLARYWARRRRHIGTQPGA